MDKLIKVPGRRITFWSLVLLCLSSVIWSVPSAAERVYTVGVVPQFDVRRIRLVWQPILKELTKRTGYQFKLVGSANIPTFEEQFADGEFDFAYMNPYHFIKANNSQGYIPLVRDHGRVLQGILVVRVDSPVEAVKQLEGQKIAFPAPNALGASLLMRANLVEDYKIDFVPRYVKSHSSVYLNVLTGRVAAGGGVQATLNQQSEEIRSQLRVLHRSGEFAPHPLAAHPRVDNQVRDEVQAALLKMGGEPQIQPLLQKVPIKKVGVALAADYQPLQEMGLERYYVRD